MSSCRPVTLLPLLRQADPTYRACLRAASNLQKPQKRLLSTSLPRLFRISRPLASTKKMASNQDSYSVSIRYKKENQNAFFSDDATVDDLLARNKAWSDKVAHDTPGFFPSLTHTQQPKILWIGCSDSRVPETTVMDLMPGEVFVHRNIANVVANGDMSMLSVVQFAVEVLEVRHVIICGHYGCGGVNAALSSKKLGLIDNWLRYVRHVRAEHIEELEALTDDSARAARLVELNVLAQIHEIERITYVAEAMESRGLQVHAMVYDVSSGRLHKLEKLEDKKKVAFVQSSSSKEASH